MLDDSHLVVRSSLAPLAKRPEGRLFLQLLDQLRFYTRHGIHTRVRGRICKRLWSPGIDSEESISPAYVAWRAGTKNRVVIPARQAGNRFLVSLKGLQIPVLEHGSNNYEDAKP